VIYRFAEHDHDTAELIKDLPVTDVIGPKSVESADPASSGTTAIPSSEKALQVIRPFCVVCHSGSRGDLPNSH
jgi:hypothetical protein